MLICHLLFVICHLANAKDKGQRTNDKAQMTIAEIAIQHSATTPDTLAGNLIASLLLVVI